MLKLIHPLDAIREKVIAADGVLKLEEPFTTQAGDTVLAVLFRQSGTVVGSLVFAGTSTEPLPFPVGEGLYDLSLSGTDIIRLRDILDPTGSGYKKISILTLARMMYFIDGVGYVDFLSSLNQRNVNTWRIAHIRFFNFDSSDECCHALFAPDCNNPAYLWKEFSGNPSQEAEEIAYFMSNLQDTVKRPDEDGRVYIRTEDWDDFLWRHPEFELDTGDVTDFYED